MKKLSKYAGINTVKHVKVSDDLKAKIDQESQSYEGGQDDLVRHALAHYLGLEQSHIWIKSNEIDERTCEIKAKVSIDTMHAINHQSIELGTSVEIVSGQILTDFVNKVETVPLLKPHEDDATLEMKLSDLFKKYSPESGNYDDFVRDVITLGIKALEFEQETGKLLFVKSENSDESSDIIKIDLNEIEDAEVRESLKSVGFLEGRYLTLKAEKQFREDFEKSMDETTRSIENIEVQLARKEAVMSDTISGIKVLLGLYYDRNSFGGFLFPKKPTELLNLFPHSVRQSLV